MEQTLSDQGWVTIPRSHYMCASIYQEYYKFVRMNFISYRSLLKLFNLNLQL
jgi:hypothetical protein